MTVKPITPDDYHYGAVEALAADIAFDAGIFGPLEGGVRDHFMEKAANRIRALEAAGYRVVGPEPTQEMIAECQGNYDNHPVLKYLTPEERGNAPLFPLAHWRAHFAAAPTLTEQKP